jgi:hypothetical protein
MRAILLALCAACMFLTLSTAAGASSAGAQAQEPGEAMADRWQGRHHYLFDEQNRPGTATTTGAASPETSGCATTTVRMRRSDGSTVLRRIRRCD